MKNLEKIKLLNTETGEIVSKTLYEVLYEINRDRSDEWTQYDRTDWQEGLEEFTEYILIEKEANKMRKHLAIKYNIYSIDDLKKHYQTNSKGHWFDEDIMSFFKSKLSQDLFYSGALIYFISSEKGPDNVRRYSVRSYNPKTSEIDTVGDFQQYSTIYQAKQAAKQLSRSEND